jgi:hypothetical protein
MNAGGWVMLIGSWAIILALNVFCFYKLLVEKPAKSITGEEKR